MTRESWVVGVFLGEEIKVPEVDLAAFLEKQRLSDSVRALSGSAPDAREDDEDEIDHSLAHITSQRQPALQSKKGRVQTIEWDDSFEQMSREKAVAEANRGSSVARTTDAEVDDVLSFAPFVLR